MGIVPKDDVSRFQVFLLLFLASSLSSTFIGAPAFAVTVVAFGAICVFFVRRLPKAQEAAAYSLFGAFGIFSLAVLLARQYASTPSATLTVFPALVVGFFLLYVLVKLYVVSWKVECKVIGYSEGYAIVETKPSISASLAPGIYAIRSGPVRKGQACFVVVGKSLFGAGKPERVETK